MNKLKYIILAFVITLLYMFARITNLDSKQTLIQIIMLEIIVVVALWIGEEKYKNKLTFEHLILAIYIVGFTLRVGYMLYTACNVRSHDLGYININGYGHAAYILKIIKTHSLPDTNTVQFYQQPFFYILGGTFSKVINFILGSNSDYNYVDAAKVVSCFASCSMLFVSRKICTEFRISYTGTAISLGIIAVLPSMCMTGGSVNCDALLGFFVLLAFLYTLYWKKEPTWKNTIILAVIYGLGIMTKISCGIVAIFTLIVFVQKFIVTLRGKEGIKPIISKLSVFALISFPLGLWYSVRNYVLFNQSLTYVVKLPVTSKIYTGDYSIVQRFLSIDITNIFKTPFGNPWSDYNIPTYFIK